MTATVATRESTREERSVGTPELLWYIPNQVRPGHRGDAVTDDR